MKDVSFLIPAREEVYLEQTIRNVLANIRGNSEIIIVLDGWKPTPQIVTNDDRVRFVYHETSIGQRAAINEAARMAEGKYICKLDAHCAIDEGFDVKMMADCEYDWTVVARMYNLDRHTFTPKLHKRTDYMFIGWNEKNELRSLYYQGDEWKKQHRKEALIDDTMGLMGPCFFMHKERFWELGGCDENHGGWGSQGIEVACKAWLSGGSLKVNKKTWFAHWFRGSDGGFPYPMSQGAVDRARQYSESLWLQDKWPQQTRTFKSLIEQFNPPTWENKMDNKVDELNQLFYKHIHLEKRHMKWRGVPVIKMPTDMIIYSQVIWDKKPDFIIDIGTKFGGSSLFYQDMLDINGNGGKVITIDKFPVAKEKDPRITYLEKGSTDAEVLAYIKEAVKGKSVMVIVDGDHRRQQVKRELVRYSDIVTTGQYLVLEDCYDRNAKKVGPGEAKDWFLSKSKKLVQTDIDQQFLVGFCRDGFLLRQ
jgi:cephalosporin hydroxylase